MLKSSKTLKIVLFFCLLVTLAYGLNGCSSGSNSPVATDLSSGTGYRIKLASSLSTVTVSGSAVITAVIYEPDGSPIRDDEEVLFASSEGGSFSDSPVKTKSGTVSTVYTAGSTPMKYDSITASCRGAVAVLQVWVLPATY